MVKSKNDNLKFDEKITLLVGSTKSLLFHTIVFVIFLTLPVFFDISYDFVLLVLTTIVSLEAIYLALFIQITVNRQAEDIEEIQEDVEEVQEDVEEINESVDEIEKDVDELAEDVEDIQEDDEKDESRKSDQKKRLEKIENTLEVLLKEIHNLRK